MENVYYPLAIRETAPSSFKARDVPEEAEVAGLEVAVATTAPDEPAKESEPSGAAETSKSLNPEVPQKATKSTTKAQATHAEEQALLVEPLQAVPPGEAARTLRPPLLSFLRRGLRPSQRNRPSRLAFVLFLFLRCFLFSFYYCYPPFFFNIGIIVMRFTK